MSFLFSIQLSPNPKIKRLQPGYKYVTLHWSLKSQHSNHPCLQLLVLFIHFLFFSQKAGHQNVFTWANSLFTFYYLSLFRLLFLLLRRVPTLWRKSSWLLQQTFPEAWEVHQPKASTLWPHDAVRPGLCGRHDIAGSG